MKKIVLFIIFILVVLLSSSCLLTETCTGTYCGDIKIDGKERGRMLIDYIGPDKRKYKQEIGYNSQEVIIPYYYSFLANTVCKTKDFKKNDYNFLRITNLDAEDIFICSNLLGQEIDNKLLPNEYGKLLLIYHEQDLNPNYDYKTDGRFKDIEYIDRYELYKKLEAEKYPYFIKLPPQKSCIMKWGGYGFVLQ